MSTPVIIFDKKTLDLLATMFGHNDPFFVVRREAIIEDDKHLGDRIYFSNGIRTVTVPNVKGLELGEKLYLQEDGQVYEWSYHLVRKYNSVPNNQTEALAFTLSPILNNNRDS